MQIAATAIEQSQAELQARMLQPGLVDDDRVFSAQVDVLTCLATARKTLELMPLTIRTQGFEQQIFTVIGLLTGKPGASTVEGHGRIKHWTLGTPVQLELQLERTTGTIVGDVAAQRDRTTVHGQARLSFVANIYALQARDMVFTDAVCGTLTTGTFHNPVGRIYTKIVINQIADITATDHQMQALVGVQGQQSSFFLAAGTVAIDSPVPDIAINGQVGQKGIGQWCASRGRKSLGIAARTALKIDIAAIAAGNDE